MRRRTADVAGKLYSARPPSLPACRREHWHFINAVCKLNSIPFDTTGQRIDRDGGWTGYEFSMQLVAEFGPDRMLCHGSIEPAFGMAEGQPAVR